MATPTPTKHSFKSEFPGMFWLGAIATVAVIILIGIVFLYSTNVNRDNDQLASGSCKLADWIEQAPPRTDIPNPEQYAQKRTVLISQLRQYADCPS